MTTDRTDQGQKHPGGDGDQTEQPRQTLRVARLLRVTREEQGLSLEAVAAQTCISRAILRAIEAENHALLPADTFTRGLITLYASLLGLDGRPTAARFLSERDDGTAPTPPPDRITLAQETNKLAEPTRISSATVASGLLLLIVVSFTLVCFAFSWNPLEFFTSKFMHSATSANAPFHPANPATKNGAQHQSINLHAAFLTDCPLVVTVDQQPAQTITFAKGTTMHWEARQQLGIVFLQPDCAALQVNGVARPFPPAVDGRFPLRLTLPPPHE